MSRWRFGASRRSSGTPTARIRAGAADTFVPIARFARPITVSFSYTASQLSSARLLESTLQVRFSADNGATWQLLPSTVDTVNRVVSGPITAPGLIELVGVRARLFIPMGGQRGG